MGKRVLLFFPILFAGGILLLGVLFLARPPSTDRRPQTVDIPHGATFLDITEQLHREGLISSPRAFLLLGRLTGRERAVKPGEYRLHRAMRPMDLLDTLVRGDVVQHRVVIPEGAASREIAAILEAADLLEAGAFYDAVHDPAFAAALGIDGASLEGYLFPETYHFRKHTPARQVARRMVMQFRTVYNDAFRARAAALGMTEHEVVTLASIIEKETALPSEREVISAVFHNRLKRKMRLQSDPTVIFSLADFDGDLRRKDLFNPSPYNTYRVAGLPPGPIANPGRAAIHAALYPAEVDYLFFVSKNNGSHHFSKTLAEHNLAVQKYQLKKNDEVMCRTCGKEDG